MRELLIELGCSARTTEAPERMARSDDICASASDAQAKHSAGREVPEKEARVVPPGTTRAVLSAARVLSRALHSSLLQVHTESPGMLGLKGPPEAHPVHTGPPVPDHRRLKQSGVGRGRVDADLLADGEALPRYVEERAVRTEAAQPGADGPALTSETAGDCGRGAVFEMTGTELLE